MCAEGAAEQPRQTAAGRGPIAFAGVDVIGQGPIAFVVGAGPGAFALCAAAEGAAFGGAANTGGLVGGKVDTYYFLLLLLYYLLGARGYARVHLECDGTLPQCGRRRADRSTPCDRRIA